MKRREFLTLAAAAAASVIASHGPALADLEPDGMTKTYRRHSLVIVGPRDDETAGAFAAAVVEVLARALPASRATLARAADTRRVGVLIGTGQQDIGIMTAKSAEALFKAESPFADIRDLPLRVIVSFGSHVLVCRPDFNAQHAYLLAQTLVQHGSTLPAPARLADGLVPAHQGSHAYFSGQKMPDA
jgi:hypothetical protein